MTVDYVILDLTQIGANNLDLYDAMRAPGGPFEVVFENQAAVVLHRVGTSPEVDVDPQKESCRILDLRHGGDGSG